MRATSAEPADPTGLLRAWTLGVIGYGNQGRAQALNLRDSGIRTIVGARPGGPSAQAASREGFEVLAPADAAERCELIALLVPDSAIGQLLASLPLDAKIRTVVLAHGFALRFGQRELPGDWDIVLVAPSGPGTALRFGDAAGRIPAFLAVHRDNSGEAWARARAYAIAAGCSPHGFIRTTVEEETEVDLFGEQAVLCGGLAALVTAAWETLVQRGYDPRVAYMECVHQVSLTAEMITRFGVAGMRERISGLALFGDLTRGPNLIGGDVKARMAEMLEEIRSGRFAEEWEREVRDGFLLSRRRLQESREHAMEGVGREVRGLFTTSTKRADESGR